MNLHPLKACLDNANKSVLARGGHVHQQFVCANCGIKQEMEEQDVFFETGTCEACGGTTDIAANGCNFVAIFSP